MNWSSQFVELDGKAHDRQSFDCGEPAINDFLKTRAARHMAAGISRTLVLPDSTPLPDDQWPICSFYTITPGEVRRKTLPPEKAKKLPHYPVPVFLIAQLGVDRRYQLQGLGKVTLIKALEQLWRVNAEMRAYAVIVDCINDQARAFYEQYGFDFLCRRNGRDRLFIPMSTVSKLF